MSEDIVKSLHASFTSLSNWIYIDLVGNFLFNLMWLMRIRRQSKMLEMLREI